MCLVIVLEGEFRLQDQPVFNHSPPPLQVLFSPYYSLFHSPVILYIRIIRCHVRDNEADDMPCLPRQRFTPLLMTSRIDLIRSPFRFSRLSVMPYRYEFSTEWILAQTSAWLASPSSHFTVEPYSLIAKKTQHRQCELDLPNPTYMIRIIGVPVFLFRVERRASWRVRLKNLKKIDYYDHYQ